MGLGLGGEVGSELRAVPGIALACGCNSGFWLANETTHTYLAGPT